MPHSLNPDRNQDVREILEDVPAAIFRYGNLLFLIIIVVFLVIAWFIKYPDILQAGVTITSTSPPVPIVANREGELTSMRVSEGDEVMKGEVLAIIRSTTAPEDAFSLLKSIESIRISEIEKLIQEERTWPENLNLGAINDDYADFLNKYYEYWRFKNYNPLDNQITQETSKLAEFGAYQGKLLQQKRIFENEIALLDRDFKRDQKLFGDQVISQKQLEEKERELLALKREYQSALLEISQVKINSADSRRMLSDFTFQKKERNQSLRLALFDSYKQLQFAIKNWERDFVLKAPIDGRISLFDYWSENQYVSRFDEIFTIVPSSASDKIGKVLLPVRNSGKLKVGQKAIIKLDDFLFQEFGTLVGTVSKFSLVPRGNLYSVEITLPNGLKTSYGRQLAFREEMRGSIEIITEELNLLERIFYDLRRRLDYKDVPKENRMEQSGTVAFLNQNGDLKATLSVEVARTAEEMKTGLMYRNAMGVNEGMVFIQANERPASIWMKNTKIALDIIFVDGERKVTEIYPNAKPMSRKQINSKMPVQYVIEVNAGYTGANSILPGDQISLSEN